MSQDHDAPLRTAIARELQKFEFVVAPVPARPNERSPDFVATKNGEEFVFELKEKVDDPFARAEERARLDAGELVSFGESLGPNDRVSNKVRDGARQLMAHNSQGRAHHLLWLHAGGRDPEIQLEQFRSTLYGMTHIFGPDLPHIFRCYYFGHSEFFRKRDLLAGAVITAPRTLQLCVNTLHPRVAEFRQSALFDSFRSGLLDPDRLEHDGDAYLADCDIDRNDEHGVLSYLESKYRRPMLMNMNLGSVGARIQVPRDTEE